MQHYKAEGDGIEQLSDINNQLLVIPGWRACGKLLAYKNWMYAAWQCKIIAGEENLTVSKLHLLHGLQNFSNL